MQAGPRSNTHPVEKPVVQRPQLWQGGGSHAQQKPPECRRIGITRQTGEVLKHAILAQQLGCLDPFQPEDHRVEQREQHLAHAVAIVPLGQAKLAGHAHL